MPPPISYQIGGHAGAVNTLTVSADGTMFASASLDGTVKVWSMASGALLHTYAVALAGTGPVAQAVALSPDGTTIAAGDNYGNIWMWRIADDSLIRQFYAFNAYGGVTSLAYSPDGTLLAAAGADNVSTGPSYRIKLYSTVNGKLKRTLVGHTAQVLQIAYSPASNSQLASISSDLTLRLWNPTTGATTKVINAFTSYAYCLVFSSDGTRVAAGGQDSASPYYYARVWNAVSGARVVNINAYQNGGVTAVAFSPDGTLLATGGSDNSFYLPKTFSTATGALVNAFGLAGGPVQALAFSQDGTMLISGGSAPGNQGGQITQWNVADGTPLVNVTELLGPISNIAISSDAQQLAVPVGGNPQTVQSFALADGTPLWFVPGAFPFSFSPDVTLFISYPNGGPTVFDISDSAPLVTLTNEYASLAWISGDDQTAYTYYTSGMLTAWKLPDGTQQNTLQLGVYYPAISADQTRMVGLPTQANQVVVLSLPDGATVQTLTVNNAFTPLAISSDGNYVAVASSTSDVYLYRVGDGALMLDQPGPPSSTVQSLAISPFGDSVAAYRSNGAVTVTAISPSGANGTELAYWNDQLGTGIASIAYTPDGASIVLGRSDGAVLVCANPAPATLAKLMLNEYQAAGGIDTPAGTVTLSQPAPSGGLTVALTSSNPAVASVPSSIVVQQNDTTALFPVTTFSVSSPTVVTITASFNGLTRSVSLTVNPAIQPKAVAFAPATLQGGQDAVGVVTLKSPAYAGGAVVSLVSAFPGAVSVPSTVTVPAGKTSVHFPVQTGPVSAVTPVTVTATAAGATVKGTITVAPATMAALTILPTSVVGGVENAVGIVTLSAPATTDTTVAISVTTATTAGDVTYPFIVTVPAGYVNTTFDIGTNAVTSNAVVTFRAQIGPNKAPGTTFKSASVTLMP
jgi:WD40 repeat protein